MGIRSEVAFLGHFPISYSKDMLWVLNPMHTLANSEDPDETLHNATFHQGLHFLLRQKLSAEREIQLYFEFITYFHCLPKCTFRSHWYTKA